VAGRQRPAGGLLTLAVAPGLPIELGLFALLTIATTYLARRFLRPLLEANNPDLNDPLQRLIGQRGQVLSTFEQGRGRVFVDGKDWAAETEEPIPAISQEGLTKTYASGHQALKTIDLDIRQGRDLRPAGPERGGQDHADQHHLRHRQSQHRHGDWPTATTWSRTTAPPAPRSGWCRRS
jgi:hypothetical protein